MGSLSNTKSPEPRPSSVPSDILIDAAICRNKYGPKILGGFSNMAGDSHIEFVYCGARGGVADKHLSDLLCLGTS